MKLLVISHAYVERANHKKLEILSAIPGLKVGVVYPRKWKTWHGEEKLAVANQESVINSTYKEFSLDTIFTGDGGRYYYALIQLIKTILDFKPDLIYMEEEPFSFVSCQLSVVCLLLRTKLTFFTWENLDLPLGNLRSLIEKFTFTIASKAVVGNQDAAERLKKRGFLKTTTLIPQFGVNVDVFHETYKDQPRNSAAPLMIGFVGRPSTAKGIDVLMKAVTLLSFDYRLLIVTSSKVVTQEFLDLAYSLGILEKAQYKTSIPHAELSKYFNQMDVFVLPSRTTKTWKEQFGRTLLEAMACGVPVVGSSSGAIPEVIGNAGLIFKEEDSHDLSDKLSRLSSEKVRKDFSEAGSKRVSENYTYQILCNNLVNFLSH